MSQTGEQPAVTITEASQVRTDLKTVLIVAGALVLGGIGYADLKSSDREHTARENTIDTRVGRLEDDRITERIERQKLRDDMDHLVETTDRIEHYLQLQQKGH